MVRPTTSRALRPRAWPIRWWLPVLTAGVVAATLITIGAVLRSQLDAALVSIAIEALRNEAQTVVEREVGPLPAQVPKPEGKPASAPKSEVKPAPPAPTESSARAFSLDRAAEALRRDLADRDTGVIVYGPDGAVVTRSEPLGGPRAWPLASPEGLARALGGQEAQFVQAQAARRVLLLLLPLRTPDGVRVGVLQLARSAELIDRLQSRVLGLVTLAGLLAVLISGVLVAWAARFALQPLGRIVEATRVIGADDLTARLCIDREDEIGELATSFDRMLDRLDASFSAQRQLVADAAHELRTPLTALGGTVEILRLGADHGDEVTVRRLLAATGHEVDRLVHLVNDLLALSNLDEARPLPTSAVDLRDVLADATERVVKLAQGRRLVRHLDAAATVSGDQDQLERLFLNLLDNALKFTPPGGTVEVRLAHDGGRAITTIADTGEGIAPDDLPRIFDRFYRGDVSRSRRAGGAGLGLAIASGIVRRHGGTIEASSTLGRGTTITVRLPLAGPGATLTESLD